MFVRIDPCRIIQNVTDPYITTNGVSRIFKGAFHHFPYIEKIKNSGNETGIYT